MDSGEITTVSRLDIKNAAPRMIQITKAWDKNDYVKGFTSSIEKRLYAHWDTFFAKPKEEQARIIGLSEAAFTARPTRGKPKKKDLATPTTSVVPKKGKSKWKLNTQVAANKTVNQGGVASLRPEDSFAPDMWVTGFLKKYNADSADPYEIHWDTQPDPLVRHKNALEVADLVENFQFCTTHRLLRGYVHLDLLWVLEPATGSLGKQYVKYAMVLPFDPIMDRYKIKFRSGIWAWKTEEHVKAAKQFTEAVLNGGHATWSYDDAQTAALEETSFTVLESQVDASETELIFQDIDMTSDKVESAGHPKPRASRTNPPRVGKMTSNTQKSSTGRKFKCDKTKVATLNVSNVRYPELQKNRTGWTAGTLKRIDASRRRPYQIGWDVETVGEPQIFHFVDEDELSLLVRHHKHCNARKLINMFCVGIDLLWPCPLPLNIARLRWVSVMFWEGKTERYKLLFRDGDDAWATGEELDKAIAFNPTYSDFVQAQASYEPWDSQAVVAKLSTYGLYCAQRVGPPSSAKAVATGSLNGRDIFPQRYASSPKSTSSDHTKEPAAPRALRGRKTSPVATVATPGPTIARAIKSVAENLDAVFLPSRRCSKPQ